MFIRTMQDIIRPKFKHVMSITKERFDLIKLDNLSTLHRKDYFDRNISFADIVAAVKEDCFGVDIPRMGRAIQGFVGDNANSTEAYVASVYKHIHSLPCDDILKQSIFALYHQNGLSNLGSQLFNYYATLTGFELKENQSKTVIKAIDMNSIEISITGYAMKLTGIDINGSPIPENNQLLPIKKEELAKADVVIQLRSNDDDDFPDEEPSQATNEVDSPYFLIKLSFVLTKHADHVNVKNKEFNLFVSQERNKEETAILSRLVSGLNDVIEHQKNTRHACDLLVKTKGDPRNNSKFPKRYQSMVFFHALSRNLTEEQLTLLLEKTKYININSCEMTYSNKPIKNINVDIFIPTRDKHRIFFNNNRSLESFQIKLTTNAERPLGVELNISGCGRELDLNNCKVESNLPVHLIFSDTWTRVIREIIIFLLLNPSVKTLNYTYSGYSGYHNAIEESIYTSLKTNAQSLETIERMVNYYLQPGLREIFFDTLYAANPKLSKTLKQKFDASQKLIGSINDIDLRVENRHITLLNVSHTNIDDGGFGLLGRMTNLKELHAEELECIDYPQLGHLPQLTDLWMSRSRMRGVRLTAPQLNTIFMSFCIYLEINTLIDLAENTNTPLSSLVLCALGCERLSGHFHQNGYWYEYNGHALTKQPAILGLLSGRKKPSAPIILDNSIRRTVSPEESYVYFTEAFLNKCELYFKVNGKYHEIENRIVQLHSQLGNNPVATDRFQTSSSLYQNRLLSRLLSVPQSDDDVALVVSILVDDIRSNRMKHFTDCEVTSGIMTLDVLSNYFHQKWSHSKEARKKLCIPIDPVLAQFICRFVSQKRLVRYNFLKKFMKDCFSQIESANCVTGRIRFFAVLSEYLLEHTISPDKQKDFAYLIARHMTEDEIANFIVLFVLGLCETGGNIRKDSLGNGSPYRLGGGLFLKSNAFAYDSTDKNIYHNFISIFILNMNNPCKLISILDKIANKLGDSLQVERAAYIISAVVKQAYRDGWHPSVTQDFNTALSQLTASLRGFQNQSQSASSKA